MLYKIGTMLLKYEQVAQRQVNLKALLHDAKALNFFAVYYNVYHENYVYDIYFKPTIPIFYKFLNWRICIHKTVAEFYIELKIIAKNDQQL